MLGILYLVIVTLILIDLGIRIYMYAKTKDPKYKHQINRWK